MSIDCAIYALRAVGWQTAMVVHNYGGKCVYVMMATNSEHMAIAVSDVLLELSEAIIELVREILEG